MSSISLLDGSSGLVERAVATRSADHALDAGPLEQLRLLWRETIGDPQICIAVLDGPVDLSHPCLQGSHLEQLESLVPGEATRGPAARHGTQVASILFGRHGSAVPGVAPGCRGLSIPIFESAGAHSFRLCSQIDLARAISLAVQHGAHVINISGGELVSAPSAYPLLENAIRQCARAGVLLVAAAGNDGCPCLHAPAALDAVLAVGAMDRDGMPFDFSNWGQAYQTHGVLAPGDDLLSALPGGGTMRATGTSYAAPIVAGLAGLLLSLQRKHGQKPDPSLVREALLKSASGCSIQPIPDCRRLLAGRLNVRGAMSFLVGSTITMEPSALNETTAIVPNQVTETQNASPVIAAQRTGTPMTTPKAPEHSHAEQTAPAPAKSSCGCGGKSAAAPQFVYALGQLSYDLISEARCDSLAQKIGGLNGHAPHRGLALDHETLLKHLETDPWDAAAVEWTLVQEGTPIYAIRPQGPFAREAYDMLCDFLKEQEAGEIERVSVPGAIAGKARLMNGQTVPVLAPELRGMYSWTTSAMVKSLLGDAPANGEAMEEKMEHDRRRAGVHNFLERVYHEVRNLGLMPQERAMNFVATNAFEIGQIYQAALKENMELDSINVVRSPICRPESDCWDVEVYFFYPERQVQTVRRVYRFTVDVSDVVPVTIGATRSWYTR